MLPVHEINYKLVITSYVGDGDALEQWQQGPAKVMEAMNISTIKLLYEMIPHEVVDLC